MDINEKVILVTGANRGIGKSISLAMANLGAKVAVTGRDLNSLNTVVEEIENHNGTAKSFTLDVTKDNQAIEVANSVLREWGRLDVLINNAGVCLYDTPVWKTSVEEWDYIMNTNLRGLFLACHAVIPHMMEQKEGCIINIGSSAGKVIEDEKGLYSYGPYATSKWGVVGYTISLAKSLIQYGITVNGINPSWVDTDMARNRVPGGSENWIKPEEIASAVKYLITEAPKTMTGQFIDMFGGD
jgi:NAD(P)-dependent dehydrogenase (short-subunit alcohol dehydrogenase family)